MAEETRTRLLDAAWTCVCAGGVSAATSRAITTEANANLGAITYYFGSKEQLLGQSLVAAIRRLIEPALHALRQQEGDPITRMLQAVAGLQHGLAESPGAVTAYLEIIVQSRRIPLLGECLGALFSELRTVLALDMSQQREQGLLPPWVDPEPMAALLLAVAQGVAVETTIDPNGPSHDAMASQFAQLLIAARQ